MTLEEETKILEEIHKEIMKKDRLLYSYEIREILDKFLKETRRETKRPQGEWVMDKEHTKNPLLWYKCNLCGVYHSPTNYCPNCGAEMKGGAKNETNN